MLGVCWGMLVALRLYCGPCGDIVVTGGDIVVTMVVLRSCRDTVFIVVALGRPVVTAGESGRPCDGVWSSRGSRTVRFLM